MIVKITLQAFDEASGVETHDIEVRDGEPFQLSHSTYTEELHIQTRTRSLTIPTKPQETIKVEVTV